MELCDQGDGAAITDRLLGDFEKQGKFVTALCAGQHVLAEHGGLKAGRTVAGGQYAEQVEGFGNAVRPPNKGGVS